MRRLPTGSPNAAGRLLADAAHSPRWSPALAAGLRAGQAFALAYAAAKRGAGAVDFDDLIRARRDAAARRPAWATGCATSSTRQTDHILVDEAQDTNERAVEHRPRAGRRVSSPARAPSRRHRDDLHRRRLQAGDLRLPGHRSGRASTSPAPGSRARREAVERDFLDLSMDRSFRSSPPILAVGRPGDRRSRPRGARPAAAAQPARERTMRSGPGSVTLVAARSPTRASADEEAGEEGWISDATRRYAATARAAGQGLARPAVPARKPGAAAAARGHPDPGPPPRRARRADRRAAPCRGRAGGGRRPAAAVGAAGGAGPARRRPLRRPAARRSQPRRLLVSPLFGWSQDELFDAALRPRGRALAAHPRPRAPEGARALSRSSPWPIMRRRTASSRRSCPARSTGGASCSSGSAPRRATRSRNCSPRRSTSRRNAAASLQAFLDWFARGEVEIVRDPSAPLDAVRVMTVHGAKGLQSPVVILADACADPDSAGPGGGSAELQLEERGRQRCRSSARARTSWPSRSKSQVERQDRPTARSIGGCSTSR